MLCLVLVLIFYSPILFGGKFLWEDFVEQEFPFRTLATSSLAAGHIPQWNPYVFSGMPFIADIQVAFWYPFNMLQSFFVSGGHLSPVVMQWFIILHYFVGAAGVRARIATRTVGFHLGNIYQKLQVHSKTEAVAKALREHLI